jgi:phosphatidylinositol-3-phosphatase
VKTTAVVLVAVAVLGCRAARAAVTPIPDFEHVIVVVFENKEAGSVLRSRNAPTFNLYGRRYARITQSYGVTHPSLPNYLALVSGSTWGIRTDCVGCSVNARSLADTIEASGRSWKTYAEGLPRPGFLGGFSGRYAKKHNPFAYFRPIAAEPERAQRLVPLRELATDLAANDVPDFALLVPDLCHSMHDCPVRVGDAWLRRTVGPLLELPRTAIFITFDEGGTRVRGGGHITTLAVGTAVRAGVRFRPVTNHYGVLRTIEQAWGLPKLGRSATARPITGIWR